MLDFPAIDTEAGLPAVVSTKATTTLPATIASIKDAALAPLKQAEADLRALAGKYQGVAFAVQTAKGMTEAKAARQELRQHGRFLVQRAETRFKDDVNDAKREVTAYCERLVGIVKPVENHIHAQIEAEEQRREAERQRLADIEQARKDKHNAAIRKILGYVDLARGATPERMLAGIDYISSIETSSTIFEEFADEATKAKADAIVAVTTLYHKALADAAEAAKRDHERAEAELVRKEKERVDAENAELRRQLAEAQATAAAKAIAETRSKEYTQRGLTEVRPRDEVMAPEACESANGQGEPVAPALAIAPTCSPCVGTMGAGQPADAGSASGPITMIEPDSPADTGERIKLGDINARLQHFTITARGLAALGFEPCESDGAARIYRACDWPAIKGAICAHVGGLA